MKDVFAIKSHALALMHSLQSMAPAIPTRVRAPSSRPSSAGGRITSNGDSPMGPPVTPSMTRSAQRARAAALANSKGVHTRTPSHAAGLGDVPKRRIDIMTRLVEVMEKSARLRYELPVQELIAW
jgi:rapamycin-insensitive companion of mTOR